MAKKMKGIKVMSMPTRGDALEKKSGFAGGKKAYKTKFGHKSAHKKI